MSIEGIVGISLTFIFGVVGIVSLCYALKRKKYPKKIEFYVLDLVNIISPFVRKYDSIKLLHNDVETQNVSFMRGMCICSGDEDVALQSSTSNGGMQIVLPMEYKWLEVHLRERTEGLEIKMTIDEKSPNILHICSDLFKRDEVFTFDAYIEGKESASLEIEDIKIHHRISEAEKVESQYVSIGRTLMRRRYIWMISGTLVLSFFLMCFVASNTLLDRPIRFADKTDKETLCSVMVVDNDSIAVSKGTRGVLPFRAERYSIDDFKKKYEINTKISPHTHTLEVLIICLLFMFGLYAIWDFVSRYRPYRHQKKIIDIYTKVIKKKSKNTNK